MVEPPQLDQNNPPIVRVRVDSLTIYEVKEEELRTIEHGSTRSDQFNFAVAALSAALTLLVALLTAKFPNDGATAVAVAVFVAFVVLGAFFLLVVPKQGRSKTYIEYDKVPYIR